jgi:SAM-dependent methyltransferase
MASTIPTSCSGRRPGATPPPSGPAGSPCGSVDQLPAALDGPFDAILAVNSLGFWPAPAERLAELRRRLAPGGRIAIASQPRCPGATAGTSRSAADEVENLLRSAGFTQMSTKTLPLSPPVICVLAAAPGPDAKHTPQT